MSTDAHPCRCWYSRPLPHEGHCCFDHYDAKANRVTCGHHEAGLALHEQAKGERP